jgi:hypothetical protein
MLHKCVQDIRIRRFHGQGSVLCAATKRYPGFDGSVDTLQYETLRDVERA